MQQAFNSRQSLGDAAHRKVMRDLRLYMLVGGMPQAVNSYLDTQNLALVDAVKREILELYNDDFYKIDPTGKAASLFKAIPAQLSGNAHRYQITPVVGDMESSSLQALLHEMEESKTRQPLLNVYQRFRGITFSSASNLMVQTDEPYDF